MENNFNKIQDVTDANYDTMKSIMRRFVSIFCLTAIISMPLFSQEKGSSILKGKIDIPDLKNYITLKCDFHTHTVFSDGFVWPTIRVEEAYREGLDVISITEHIEHHPFIKDASHNLSYEIAEVQAKARGIIIIKGSEIGVSPMAMPPGFHNAIFLTNSDELDKPDYMDAMRAAKAQNAFIFWNHPGWLYQQPDTTVWWPAHTQLLEQGLMHGIEVANGYCDAYFPEAHRWCLEKNLTMLGNSDAHRPMQSVVDFAAGEHRTMTLVFARSATVEGIRDALNERRTAVYHQAYIIGEEEYLKELFENALEWKVEKSGNIVKAGEEVLITVKNKSDLIFHLKETNHDTRIIYFRNMSITPYTIKPHSVQTFTVRLLDGIQGGDVNFIVENFLVKPNTGMKYTIQVK